MIPSMTDTPQELLEQYFGFQDFRPGQLEVIEALLAGKSAAAVFPTGSGKSLCYQLPALALPGVTLVVSPLIALMKDQIDSLERRGISAARLDSSLELEGYREVVERLRGGDLKMLFVAPERFNNERFREAITGQPISLFAIDEAHCISEWGHNFRPDYLKLAEYARQFRAERVLALTATATEPVLQDICRVFSIEPQNAIRTGFYRPNLTLLTTPVRDDERDSQLLARLAERPKGATIVYVTQQRTSEELAGRLVAAGHSARAYHAGLKAEERTAVQDWFLGGEKNIVVATIAFGMGIDKSNIRAIYHYNLPKGLENYSQEIGRAGRDGEPSICEMFACRDDLHILENFARGDTPDLESVAGLVQEVLFDSPPGEKGQIELDLYDLSFRNDLREIVARTLLTYLELEGFLRSGTPFYSTYQFIPHMSSAEMLASFDAARRDFLKTIFQQAKKRVKWFDVDVAAAAQATKSPRERVIRALNYLAEQGLIELKVAGVRHRFQKLKEPDDVAALTAKLHRRMIDREKADLARLSQVLELVEGDECQVRKLCRHFGEERGVDCGHCSWCLGSRNLRAEAKPNASIDDRTWQAAIALRRKHAPLRQPRAFARFLCGITSPQLTRAKLTSESLFGSLGSVPFGEVLARAEKGN